MKGTRPLDNAEIRKASEAFDGVFAVRNRSLFILGVSVGGRISELLALKVNDVWQNNKPVKDLLFDRNIVKGGEVSRAVPVNVDGRKAIEALIAWHIELYGNADPTRPLFPSRKGQGLKTMTRIAAHNALKGAFEAAGLNGKLGTHSLRKSYAQRLYEQTNDIYAVQEMLGHKSVVTTQRYLGVNYASVRDASEAMSIHAELNVSGKTLSSVDDATDDVLLIELLRRGYDVAQLLEKKDTPQPFQLPADEESSVISV
ncbi:MAG: tyrosine-type recombinase/integrase [Candidatus Poribacteria bacterium]|nr:tyrosine-type recombinase/integrase [Candidatus Poribacteria bacterium]